MFKTSIDQIEPAERRRSNSLIIPKGTDQLDSFCRIISVKQQVNFHHRIERNDIHTFYQCLKAVPQIELSFGPLLTFQVDGDKITLLNVNEIQDENIQQNLHNYATTSKSKINSSPLFPRLVPKSWSLTLHSTVNKYNALFIFHEV